MANLLFYFLSAMAIGAAVTVVLARNPVISVLSLLGSFFCLAGIYLLAGFQFMAAAQLLVYAGAIMVLFLFVIMLLNMGDEDSYLLIEPEGLGKRAAVPLLVAAGMMLAGMLAVQRSALPDFDPTVAAAGIDDVDRIAAQIFSRFSLPFEAASILLLATAVGVIVLAKRERGRSAPESIGEEAAALRPEPSSSPASPDAGAPTGPTDLAPRKDTVETGAGA